MKEVWVKVVAWRRHLIEDDKEDDVGAVLSGDFTGYEYFVDFFDKNTAEEYDNMVPFIDSEQKMTFDIVDPGLRVPQTG